MSVNASQDLTYLFAKINIFPGRRLSEFQFTHSPAGKKLKSLSLDLLKLYAQKESI
jgi:hypothetical protein